MDALDHVLKIEEKLVTKATLANIPLGGTFELLPLCNMNCDMCFIRLDKSEMDRIGQLKSADEWLRVAEQMRKAGTLFVLLTGGEPFLYPEFIKLYKGLKKLGMIITITALVILVMAAVLWLAPIRELAQTKLSEDDYKTLLKLTEIAVRWARQWMKTATGEEKKAKVAGYLLRKAQALGLNVDEEDIDKVIEAVYDKIKNEKWEDAAVPPLEAE